jgi:hypothetical protein
MALLRLSFPAPHQPCLHPARAAAGAAPDKEGNKEEEQEEEEEAEKEGTHETNVVCPSTHSASWPVISFLALMPELGGASALQQLLLGSHGTGASWSALGQLRQLSVLLEPVASCILPAQWSTLAPTLRRLALLGGHSMGTLPGAQSALSQLPSLVLASLPGLGGGVLPFWQAPCVMPSLAAVSVTAVPLFAANSSPLIISCYGWLSAKLLAALKLAGQGLAGALDPALPAMLAALADLLLSGNLDMSGSIPPELYAFNAMRRLELAGSGLSGALPAWLWVIHADGGALLDLASSSLTGARRGSTCAAAASIYPPAPLLESCEGLQSPGLRRSMVAPGLPAPGLPAPGLPAPGPYPLHPHTGTLPPEWASKSASLLYLEGNQLQGPAWSATISSFTLDGTGPTGERGASARASASLAWPCQPCRCLR